MNEITLIGIDLAKNIFRINCVDKNGNPLSPTYAPKSIENYKALIRKKQIRTL